MKRMILSLVAVLLLSLFYLPQEAAAQVRGGAGFSRGGFVSTPGFFFGRPPVVIIGPGPFFFPRQRFFRFGNPVFFFPNQGFVGQPVIVSYPFFCFLDQSAFINEASFFEHLHASHGIAYETIPTVIVQNGPQLFFFGW